MTTIRFQCPRSIFDPNERNWRMAIDPVSSAAATSLEPFLRTQIAETDALVRLPDATVAAPEDQYLFDMFIPKIYQGGDQASTDRRCRTHSEGFAG